jgi:hypothetical protein
VIAVALFCTMPGNGPVTRMRFALEFVAAGFLALGLASIQLLPSLEWILNAHRSLESIWPPLPLRAVLAFVSRDVVRSTNSAGLDIPEQAAYMSMMFFVAVPVAALQTSKRLLLFLVVGCLSLFSIIYGVGPLLLLLNKVPYLGLKQWRFLLVLSLALAVLAGLGVSALEQRFSSRGFRWKAALLAAAGLAAGVVMIYGLHVRTHEFVEGMRMPRASLIFLLISSAVVFARIGGLLSHSKFSVLAVFVVAVDVLTFSYGYLPFVRAHDVFPPIALFDRLKEIKGDPFRIAQLEVAYAANSEAVYGLDTAIGYEIPLERIVRFMKGAAVDGGDAILADSGALLGLKDRRFDMLNVRYFLILNSDKNADELRKQPDRFRFAYSAGNTDVFENLRALPRAFLVPASGIEVLSEESAQLARVADPSFDPEQQVILDQGPQGASGPEVAVSAGRPVEWMERSANHFLLKVRSPKASVLVASQIYYPGWHAEIDNVAVPVVPANYALASIFVPPGEHEIRFYYLPFSIKVGGSASVISLVVVSVFFGLGRVRQRRDSDEWVALNPTIRTTLVWLAGAVIVIGCFWNLHATNVDVTNFPTRSQEDIAILENQYSKISKELDRADPAAKRFGYMTPLTLQGVPPDPAADLRWTELRYVMIPRILVRGTAEPYVIGDFKKGEPLPVIPDNLVQVFDSGNGMILYKQRQAP